MPFLQKKKKNYKSSSNIAPLKWAMSTTEHEQLRLEIHLSIYYGWK